MAETDIFQLNSIELTFDRAVFESSTGARVESIRVELNEESELATITFADSLALGTGRLHIEFTGLLNDKLKGFYRTKYTHPSGEERYSATTQFAPADARRCFPCWDEPALKATFDVSIIADKDKTVLSNMPLIDVVPIEGNLHRFRFERTPIMSTYLVAFVVGEYDYVEERDQNRVLIRCYTPLGKSEQGRLALEVS